MSRTKTINGVTYRRGGTVHNGDYPWCAIVNITKPDDIRRFLVAAWDALPFDEDEPSGAVRPEPRERIGE